jgi:uncharacterized SAM-binding protein YcdF (DUF218 family)
MSPTPTAPGEEGSAPRTVSRLGLAARVLRRLWRTMFSVCVVLAIVVVIGFTWFLDHVATAEPPLPARADGIVALTGGASRVSDAIELLAAGRGKRLLITGVHPSAKPKDIARHVPEYERIFACCVDLDRSAINTLGNATEARRWAERHGFHSLIVVTSAYHMPRAMAELGHQLPDVKLVAFPVVTEKMRGGQWWSSPSTARLLISEYAKFLLAMVRMRVSPDAQALAADGISTNVPPHASAAAAR